MRQRLSQHLAQGVQHRRRVTKRVNNCVHAGALGHPEGPLFKRLVSIAEVGTLMV